MNSLLQYLRHLMIAGILVLTGVIGGTASAQEGEDAAAFPLGVATAFCDPGYIGVFDGCTPWEGVNVSSSQLMAASARPA